MSTTFSVIIPVFNGESYISHAVESALSQTYDSFEVIIVDDGSTDGTWDILSALEHDVRVRIRRQDNRGVSAARNTAMDLAVGKWIAFLDADDIWHREKLARCHTILENMPDSTLLYHGTTLETGAHGMGSGFVVTKTLAEVYAFPYLVTSSVVVAASLAKAVGFFDESLATAEDLDFYLKCSTNGTTAHLDLALTQKIGRADSLGASIRSVRDNIEVRRRYCSYNPVFCRSQASLIRRVDQNLHISLVRRLIVDRQLPEAERVLLDAKDRTGGSPEALGLLVKIRVLAVLMQLGLENRRPLE